MARFQWMAGNLGFYGYDQLTKYSLSGLGAAGAVLTYDTGQGVLNPAVMAARVEMSFAGYTAYVIETGPRAGEVKVTGGTLTGLRYLDADGDLLLEVTKLAVALPIFLATLDRGDAFSAWGMVTRGANALTGSANASGPGHAGTGDVIDTGRGADAVLAQGGDDFIKDQGGTDSYNGGTGFDTVSYAGWFFQPQNVDSGIRADLSLGTITGPDGAVDAVTGIEAVEGSFLADVLKGNVGANKFAGLAGADTIDGRGGFDMVSYQGDAGQGGTDGIKVNLVAGTARDGFGTLDRLISIEGIEGTAAADSFNDNGSNSYFDGGAGDDVFRFGAGNDTGHGGAGTDTFAFKGTAFDDDTVDDFSLADGDQIRFEAATRFADLTLTNVTVNGAAAVNVQFGSGSVTLLGVTVAQLDAGDFGF